MKSYDQFKTDSKKRKEKLKNKKVGNVEVMPIIKDGHGKGMTTRATNEEVLNEKSVSKSQQRFFGMVRKAQKEGEKKASSPEVARVASSIKMKDAKKFASTKHKGLPNKVVQKEGLDSKDKPFIKKLVGKLRGGSKTHAKQADDLEKAMKEESNPRIPRKKGQPAGSKKHSDLYTDENPKGTIHGLGFKDVATAKASVSKIRNSSRSHAHKIQAAVAMEQRAREMGKTSEAAVYRKYINSMKKKTKKMNEAANPAQQAAIAISMKKKGIKPKNLKEQISFPQMQERIRNAKEKRREQQKKSEKLYMDTKKKGVKFYDKKGTGRLKDGKKVYD